jgi:hypothetical protein
MPRVCAVYGCGNEGTPEIQLFRLVIIRLKVLSIISEFYFSSILSQVYESYHNGILCSMDEYEILEWAPVPLHCYYLISYFHAGYALAKEHDQCVGL